MMGELSASLAHELKQPLAAEGFCLLNLLVHPDDRAALRVWVGLGAKGYRSGSYRALRDAAERAEQEPSEVLASAAAGATKFPYQSQLIPRWNELKRRIAAIENLEGLELVRAIWSPQATKCNDIRLMAENLAAEYPTAAELFDAIREQITQPQLPGADSDIIRVMSLHQSKGLTAHLVVITGCVDGALPTIDGEVAPAEQKAQLHEQRRVFYVAITRATNTLVISSSTSMTLGDAMAAGVPVRSRFFVGAMPMARTTASRFTSQLGGSAPATITGGNWRLLAGF